MSFANEETRVTQSEPEDWQEKVASSLVNAMAKENPEASRQQLENLRQKILKPGTVSWKTLAGFWGKSGRRQTRADKNKRN